MQAATGTTAEGSVEEPDDERRATTKAAPANGPAGGERRDVRLDAARATAAAAVAARRQAEAERDAANLLPHAGPPPALPGKNAGRNRRKKINKRRKRERRAAEWQAQWESMGGTGQPPPMPPRPPPTHPPWPDTGQWRTFEEEAKWRPRPWATPEWHTSPQDTPNPLVARANRYADALADAARAAGTAHEQDEPSDDAGARDGPVVHASKKAHKRKNRSAGRGFRQRENNRRLRKARAERRDGAARRATAQPAAAAGTKLIPAGHTRGGVRMRALARKVTGVAANLLRGTAAATRTGDVYALRRVAEAASAALDTACGSQ